MYVVRAFASDVKKLLQIKRFCNDSFIDGLASIKQLQAQQTSGEKHFNNGINFIGYSMSKRL